ncbi:MAG: hypothetical protein BHW55_02355 [Candidatus Melainabacteria bacterium 35_41]|nr:MAG: hypothetical protein BHW55_02355 [Candidatus Melainabacteria bacterium 35_41]
MSSLIPVFYKDYLSTINNFENFHNEVINMPRDSFSTATYSKIRSLASYLLLTEDEFNTSEGHNYKEILGFITNKIGIGKKALHPNSEFENRYFNPHISLNDLYDAEGRMFRHLMGIMAFFGVIKSFSRQKKIIKFETCKEIALSDDNLLMSILRNNWLSDNINTNDYIQNLNGIEISINANYRPTFSILKYLKEINRPATFFEISILLGRIDKLQSEKDILTRAIKISSELPIHQDEQVEYFFKQMNWTNANNELFQYAASQQPYFKFKSFILYMKDFDLINLNENDNTISLSESSSKLLEEDIPIELLDLEKLLYMIDDDNETEATLQNIVINKRTPQIIKAIQEDSVLVEKINKRAIRNVEYDSNNKRKRNKFIIELAKAKADYTCEATGRKTFKMSNGQYYVEAHHIIEFSRENGPDITENLIVLGPEKHMLIHHACQEEKEDLYNHLKTNGKINIERFKKMHTIYGCLTEEHIEILHKKKLISSIDKEQLLDLLVS